MEHISHNKVIEVIFQGVKSFSGINTTIECVLVNHITFGVIEIIAFEKLHQIETSRIYVDDSIAREVMEPESASIADYLLRRICISKYLPDLKLIELNLSSDGDGPHITCSRPSGLKPFTFHTVSEKDLPDLQRSASSINEGLSAHDRWRIPIIFAKMDKGTPLSARDTQIWAAFTQNKCEEEVLASVASALSEQLPVDPCALQDTIQSATMPTNTPFPSHCDMPGRMVSSRSFSDFSKLDGPDDDSELFMLPVLARTQSYAGVGSSPRSTTSVSPSPRSAELNVPSPSNRKSRAPLPRSGTNSKLSSPTAKSGIADLATMPAQVLVQVDVGVVKPSKGGDANAASTGSGHKRVHSLSVLDSLADVLQRGLGLHTRDPYVRTDTASSESDLGVERGVSVEDLSGTSQGIGFAGSGSSKKIPYTPPVSPRVVLDPFPPHSEYTTPVRRHSYTHALSPQVQAAQEAALVALKTSPQSSKSPPSAQSPLKQSPSSRGQSSSGSGSGNEGVREGVRQRAHSRSPSPSFLRSLAQWGGGTSKVAPGGGWEEENSF